MKIWKMLKCSSSEPCVFSADTCLLLTCKQVFLEVYTYYKLVFYMIWWKPQYNSPG